MKVETISGKTGKRMSSNATIVWVLLFVTLQILVSSCNFRVPPEKSIIVILVENLGFNSFTCSEGVDQETDLGFRTFCDEAVRFTHAYTPSTMSQATLASLITGRYPFEHGVRHNGADALSAKIETVPELAVRKKYRTSFFSGGAPIWRKSGLAQGFEYFDDNLQPALNRVYRPASEVVQLFLKWQASEAPHGQFLSFLFLSDLQFIDEPTTNEIGELRESSFESQLDEVRESIAKLIRELKRRQMWDSSYVVLAGLNAAASEQRRGETRAISLSSESTRVALMMKPARRGRDGPFNWKIDANVSLVDVGATLADLLGRKVQVYKSEAPVAEVVSLKTVLQGPEPDWAEDRLVLSETAWAQWRKIGSTRFAVRKGPDLLVQDKQNQLYDTLTDSLESAPIPSYDPQSHSVRRELARFLETIQSSPWQPPSRDEIAKFELARELWRHRTPSQDTLLKLKALATKYPNDIELTGWRAVWALRLANWRELKSIAEKADHEPVWAYVAARNLGEKTALPSDPCLAFLRVMRSASWHLDKNCNNDGLADLIFWANETADAATRLKAMESFIRRYALRALADRISEQNFVTGLQWDTNTSRLQAPDIVDLVLALPELRKYRSLVMHRLLTPTTP